MLKRSRIRTILKAIDGRERISWERDVLERFREDLPCLTNRIAYGSLAELRDVLKYRLSELNDIIGLGTEPRGEGQN